jgi:glutamyl-tRNA synthetase
MILLRSDGVPTYMLAVVVDDHDMGVNHVIRGDDHLNNTFRQNLIYQAMGWTVPVYAHIPLILAADGSKMSKRHGAASVEEYREMGYLPEAMRNHLLRLGWGHGDEEIISDTRALELFSLSGIHASPARFDMEKLNFFNAHYLKLADNNRLSSLTRDIMQKRNLTIDDLGVSRITAQMDELKSRAKTIVQIADESEFFVKKIPYDFDEKAKAQLTGSALLILDQLAVNFKNMEKFEATEIDKTCRNLAETATAGKLGQIMMPLRAALTGRMVSPSLPLACQIMGKDEVLARIEYAKSFALSQAL